ncbi:unnamed protein product [Cuscuta campestris]|uniref:non-specific serine/threonine protein kinase n=1 Tax=Cuscuta campestris TaxID=132261 RepID=A0A484MBR5_9ASTE|nr:unnamed protein product [Cuscuta campestris]
MHVQSGCLLLFLLQSSIIFTDSNGEPEANVMKGLASSLSPTPKGWNASLSHCRWPGVTCDSSFQVTDIDLSRRSLLGTLPGNLNSLSKLTYLYLDNNHFTGSMPSLANLTFLQDTTMDYNNFTSIPDDAFEGLINLVYFSIGNNPKLSPWTFPGVQLQRSQYLNRFNASRSSLSGTLPDMFGSWPALQEFDLTYNSFVGSLPRSFAGSNIYTLWLSDQEEGFSGALDVLANMSSLWSVWLNGNKFQGPIPDLSKCTSIIELGLEDNLLTGIVPLSLMALPNLDYIDLHNNKLQGPLPVFGWNVTAIVGETTNNFCKVTPGSCDQQVMALLQVSEALGYPAKLGDGWKGNNACNQWVFVRCDSSKNNVTIIDFSKQHFNGTISPAFRNLTFLVELHLNDNNLTGTIPESLTHLTKLKIMDISRNNILPPLPHFASHVNVTVSGNPKLVTRSGHTGGTGFQVRSSRRKASTKVVVFLIVLGAFITIIFVVCILVYKKRKPMKQVDVLGKSQHFLPDSPTRFSYEVLKAATNNFDMQRRLGGGGFGSVFEGILSNGSRVAVKRLDHFGQGMKEFLAEVHTIGGIHHLNLVKLVGFCAEQAHRLLVYEYMSNGSLDKCIFLDGSKTGLNWDTRKRVVLHIAKGLEYLHEDCAKRIAHLDIKPQNVLLDEGFNAKLSDFGLAKLIDRDQDYVMTQMRGTRGYLAPEWLGGKITEKADVYSYGVVLLEVVFQRQNLSDDRLIDIVREKVEQSELSVLIDKCIEDDEQENGPQVEEMIELALWCLHVDPNRRPAMSTVVKTLEGAMNIQSCITISRKDFLPSAMGISTTSVATVSSSSAGPR